MKLEDAAQQYLGSLVADGRSTHTIGAYRRDLAAFTRFAGDLELDAVIPALLQRFMGSPLVQTGPTGQPRAKASVNRFRVALKALFGWAEARWLIARNPTAILKCQRPKPLPRETLSESELEQVLCTEYRGRHGPRDKAILAFMLLTGCRLGETVALSTSDIDWSRQTATLRRPKGGDPDRVPLSPRCVALLRACETPGTLASLPLFRSGSGKRLSCRQVQRIVASRLKEAGIERHLSPHALRHTFATRLYNQTGDIRLVQTALRHEHLATTEIYAHVDPQRLRKAVGNSTPSP